MQAFGVPPVRYTRERHREREGVERERGRCHWHENNCFILNNSVILNFHLKLFYHRSLDVTVKVVRHPSYCSVVVYNECLIIFPIFSSIDYQWNVSVFVSYHGDVLILSKRFLIFSLDLFRGLTFTVYRPRVNVH